MSPVASAICNCAHQGQNVDCPLDFLLAAAAFSSCLVGPSGSPPTALARRSAIDVHTAQPAPTPQPVTPPPKPPLTPPVSTPPVVPVVPPAVTPPPSATPKPPTPASPPDQTTQSPPTPPPNDLGRGAEDRARRLIRPPRQPPVMVPATPRMRARPRTTSSSDWGARSRNNLRLALPMVCARAGSARAPRKDPAVSCYRHIQAPVVDSLGVVLAGLYVQLGLAAGIQSCATPIGKCAWDSQRPAYNCGGAPSMSGTGPAWGACLPSQGQE